MADALATLDTGLGPDAVRAAGPLRAGVPGRRPGARAAARPARGDAAHPGRQREPGARSASRARRRPRARARARATPRRSRGSRPSFADGPPARRRRRDAARASCGRPPGTRRPRSPGQLRYIREHWGALLGDALLDLARPASTSRSGSWPRRSARCTLRFGAGPGRAAVRSRPRASAASATSRRRSRPIRPGCRRSC